ncbi:dynamin GTPase [Apiospora sp. TS-2023a]
MALHESCPEPLKDLCSEDQLRLLDSINLLRPQGINHEVSPPQIIVCGDQSSGKSSVLQAITGLSFPVGINVCTRFPIKYAWRRDPRFNVSASVIPLHPWDEADKKVIRSRDAVCETMDDMDSLIDVAKEITDISPTDVLLQTRTFQKEMSGPNQPHFSIVDLPGLVPTKMKHLEHCDAQHIQDVVTSFMKNPQSIILAVVSAKDDFVNQDVLYLAHSLDPGGSRTLGVITKPDTLDPGSKKEARYASLAQNQEIEFDLGWHVLMSSDSDVGEITLASRDEQETAFLSQGVWEQLPRSILGAGQLRSRLRKILADQTTVDMPALMSDIGRNRSACAEELANLGPPRRTFYEQQFHLLQISQSFQRIAKSAIDGNWNHPFFEVSDETPDDFQCRIRAAVQNISINFSRYLRKFGHRREITSREEDSEDEGSEGEGEEEGENKEDECEEKEKEKGKEKGAEEEEDKEMGENEHDMSLLGEWILLTRTEYVEQVKEKMKQLRGCELPGILNPMVVGDLFRQQSAPWEPLARRYTRRTWRICNKFLEEAITYVADDPGTAAAILREIVKPSMDRIRKGVQEKTEHILQFHRRIQPITYSPELKQKLDEMRTTRRRAALSRTLKSFFNMQRTRTVEHGEFKLNDLIEVIEEEYTEPDVETSLASDALDIMEAYYNIAVGRFIDNLAIDVVEVCLMSALPDIFSPVGVYKMDPVLLRSVAGESEDRRALRARLSEQLEVLTEAARTCKHFETITDTGEYTNHLSTKSALFGQYPWKRLLTYGGLYSRINSVRQARYPF